MALAQSNEDDGVMAGINITPFTDVLLVLLIIFMILTSVTHEQPLPPAKNTQALQRSQIVVSIDAQNHIAIGARSVSLLELPAAFRRLAEATEHQASSVIIKADPHARYGSLIAVMDAARRANMTTFGLANRVEGSP